MKHFLPLLLFAFAPIFAMSQATSLIISEFAEGSGNNKYIEIYNGTAAAVDLSLYSLSSCSNGCNVFNEFDYPDNITFAPGTMLASGATYIISHPSADSIILAVANQNFTFLSNGDDLYALTLAGATPSVYTIIDILGDMQGDPGTNWPVAGVTPGTQNHTMVRRPNVCTGNPVELASFGIDSTSSEWWVFPSNYWDSLGTHTDDCLTASCNTTSSMTQIVCESYTTPSGAVITMSGTILDTIPNAANCDSIITINLTVNPLPTITFTTVDTLCMNASPITLSATPTGGTFSGTGVSGMTFDPTAAGMGSSIITYSYTDTSSNCSNTAISTIVVEGCASLNEINANNVTVYPNPTKGNIAISFEGADASVAVMDVKGQILVTNTIVSNQSIDLSTLSSGTYFVKVTVDGNSFTQRIIVE